MQDLSMWLPRREFASGENGKCVLSAPNTALYNPSTRFHSLLTVAGALQIRLSVSLRHPKRCHQHQVLIKAGITGKPELLSFIPFP
eukprot:s3338_g7.t1